MELSISDFPEEAFRIMIKAKYDRSEEGTGQLDIFSINTVYKNTGRITRASFVLGILLF